MFALMPEPPPELPVELIRNERYSLFLSPMPSANIVGRIRVEADALPSTVNEVCELLRLRSRTQAAWTIDSGETPADLEQNLLALGMVPYDEPPLESTASAMAIVTPPSGSTSGGIEAREVRTHEEVDQFIDVEQSAVGLSPADLDGMRASATCCSICALRDTRAREAVLPRSPRGRARRRCPRQLPPLRR